MNIKKINIRNLSQAEYDRNSFLANEENKLENVLLNPKKLLSNIFEENKFTKRNFSSYSKWVRGASKWEFTKEVKDFKEIITGKLNSNWNHEIGKIIVMKKINKKTTSGDIDESVIRYAELNNYLKKEIIKFLGDDNCYIIREYKTAKEFKIIFGIK